MIMHETLCQVYEMVFVLLGQGERLKHKGLSIPHDDYSTKRNRLSRADFIKGDC